jgi:hypothetical protein
MKYIVKLGVKISKSFYGNNNTHPFFGTGQGSGNSPHIWTMLSSKLIKIHEERTKGAQYSKPSQFNKTAMHLTAYVDDTNSHFA